MLIFVKMSEEKAVPKVGRGCAKNENVERKNPFCVRVAVIFGEFFYNLWLFMLAIRLFENEGFQSLYLVVNTNDNKTYL